MRRAAAAANVDKTLASSVRGIRHTVIKRRPFTDTRLYVRESYKKRRKEDTLT